MTKKLKAIFVVAILFVVVLLKNLVFSDNSDVVTAVTSEVISAVSKEVVDGREDSNKVDYDQQKIIALAPHVVEVLFDLGVGERIVATTEHSDFPAAALDIPRIGNYARLKIEQILAYQPDIIIAWRTGNPSDDLQRLEKLGLNIVYSDPVNLADVAKELRLFGKLTGRAAIAEQKAQSFEQSLNALQQKYQNKADIKVFYELWSKPLTTVAKNAWPQQHLSICGARNPFIELVNDYPQINIEQIIVADPDLIIQPMSQGEPNPDAIDWQKFLQVNAAKHQQLLQPNSDILHRMSYRLLTELELLCENIDNSRNYYQQLTVKTPNKVN